MEVGAVKQAFNNEIILLKKKLNQAKTQVIHKLTRKAKTLAEKKAPEHLKEKTKRKAESAVNEVLIIKKIKARDIAKFSITHTGKLNDYLNKPKVDNDKACARLLLHKALQDKYKYIQSRFSGVPIKDLFMSRQERRKIKKEARDNKKNKNKKKDKPQAVNSEGNWKVEDVEMADNKEISDEEKEVSENEKDNGSDDYNSNENDDLSNDEELVKDSGKNIVESDNQVSSDDEIHSESENEQHEEQEESENEQHEEQEESENEQHEQQGIEIVGKFVKSPSKRIPGIPVLSVTKTAVTNDVKITSKKEITKKPVAKTKLKDINKNKNFNEKILQRKFKKETEELTIASKKVVDPFFITSTGENYMSLAEPRLPDEVKEEHQQGNRKLRRAVMFGHVPNIKPRNNNYREDNQRQDDRFNRQNGFEKGTRENRFNDKSGNNDRGNKFNDRASNFNDRGSKFNDRNKRNDQDDTKPEKLHPSWEAKKRQSGILPFKGKKTVFDES